MGQVVLPLLGALGGGVAAYTAIRSDLAAMKATLEILAKSVERAHVRIDELHK
jgi:hypothetical protein